MDLRSALAFVTALLFGGPTAHAAGIVTNPGFEEIGPGNFPADWGRVGGIVEVTTDAHTGERALRFERPATDAPPETGLNRAWTPFGGEQGKTLAVLKGGIRFWYKALRSDGCRMFVYVIPMTADPIEKTGSLRASFEVPRSHVGDGRWHEGVLKYDFTDNDKVKWVHVSVRLIGGPGEMLFDDVRYVEKVGPQMQLAKPRLFEIKGSAGRQCLVAVDLMNTGDRPLRDVAVTLSLPEGLTAEPAKQSVAGVGVDGEAVLQWTVTGGRRSGTEVLFNARSRTLVADAAFRMESEVEMESVMVDRFLLCPGESTTVRARVRNTGSAAFEGLLQVGEAHGCRAMGTPEVPSHLLKVLPSEVVERDWPLTAGQDEGQATVTVGIAAQGEDPIQGTAQLEITRAAGADPRHLAGPLWCQEGGGRVIGALRAGARPVATLPYLARCAFHNARGQVEYVAPADSKLGPVLDTDGAEWKFGLQCQKLSATVTKVTCTVECDRPRALLAFEGPMLYVSGKRSQAVFGGLEWLVDDEVSSGVLDIDRDHPHRVRYVPHPNMVTIPFMAVTTEEGSVGLIWDVHHQWDGEHDRQQPVFASPDWFEGRAAHLMGLMAPNVLTGLPVNERLAAEPYGLRAGQTLRLTGEIVVRPGSTDPLDVMDEWFIHHRPAPVLPAPQGDYGKWFDFSMQAYTKTLYLADEKAWLPFLGGPSIWRKPGHRTNFCWDLLMAARVTKSAGLAQEYRDLANAQARLANASARSEDLGFDYAGVDQLLPHLAMQAASLLRGTDDDGAWHFNANRRDGGVFKGKDYHVLGEHDAVELGICARKAYDLLRYTRISGDADAYWQGVKTLELMKRFRVPRAAQVWEVPVHTPDILAASDAVEAYLEAFRFSGERKWLGEAIRWARAGLPFVYVWNDERYPWMRYGSIPVFGATWFRGSWFGRLVQWNGLRHAYALLKLHNYAPQGYGGLTWREWARGITHSGMYQQSTEEENLTLWPDAYNCLDGARVRWDFAPYRIVKNVCTLIGREMEPETVILARGESKRLDDVPKPVGRSAALDRIHITSGAIIERAAWQGEQLNVSLSYPTQESGYTLITGVDRPKHVTANGKALVERKKLTDGDTAGFSYSFVHKSLSIRLTRDGSTRLTVGDIRYRRPSFMPKVVERIAFEFEDDLAGWTASHHLESFEIRDGALVTKATGGDPYMIRSACRIPPGVVSTIVVRMRVTAGSGPSVYWTTTDSPAFAEDKVVRFTSIADGQFHEYRVNVGAHGMWQGKTITALRLDATNGAPRAAIEVDYIRGR